MSRLRVDRFQPPLFDDDDESVSTREAAAVVWIIVCVMAIVIGMLLLATPAKGDELVWARTATWSSDLYVYSPPTSAGPLSYASSNCQPLSSVSPGGAALVRDFGARMCTNLFVHDFGTIAAAPGLRQFSKLSFRSQPSSVPITVNVPPLIPIPAAGVRVGPISNGEVDGTWINLLTASQGGYVTLRVFDASGALAGTETVFLTPPAVQYKLSVVVEAGSLEIVLGTSGFGCPSCGPPTGPVYGFLTVGSTSGSNLSTIPLN